MGHVFGAGAFVMEDHQHLSKATATSFCRLIVMNCDKFLFAVLLLASIDASLRYINLAEA